ncbi:MAG: hypothetical protein HFG03_10655, partial [Oscillibacter sp.]|nr:hypothetical protein [Oscillibacter sp.]
MMECVHYRVSGREAASFRPGLPFPAGTGAPAELFLVQREPVWSFAAWRVTDGRQLTARRRRERKPAFFWWKTTASTGKS